MFQVGTGLPTSGAQPYNALIPTSLEQYNAFLLFDLDPNEPGLDTLYLSDSWQNNSSLDKWSLVNGTWEFNNDIPFPSNPTDSHFGLTGIASGDTVTLYVTSTSAGNGPSSLSIVSDTSGYNADNNGSFTRLVDAPFNTVFKGVAMAPSLASVVTTSGGSASYIEDSPATLLDPALTVADADSAMLTAATVAISGGFVSTEDVLTFTPAGGITGSFSAADGKLRLSGAATVADYQTALRSVRVIRARVKTRTPARARSRSRFRMKPA